MSRDIFQIGYPELLRSACLNKDLYPVEETVTAGSSSFTYDSLNDQQVYVWKIDKKWAGTCGELQVMLNDGSGTVIPANFKFLK
jgi:hypothetical protein